MLANDPLCQDHKELQQVTPEIRSHSLQADTVTDKRPIKVSIHSEVTNTTSFPYIYENLKHLKIREGD